MFIGSTTLSGDIVCRLYLAGWRPRPL